ncbi:unnamed protein product, partial [Didymodactylos carnosus]
KLIIQVLENDYGLDKFGKLKFDHIFKVDEKITIIHSKLAENKVLLDAMVQDKKQIENTLNYDLRSNLLFFGIDEMENENTNEMILHIAECLDIPVYEIDISRSHRVGKYNPQSSTPRPIIVRFTSYRSRELFYKNHQYLNETEYYYVTVCEDLTRENLNLLRRCIELR